MGGSGIARIYVKTTPKYASFGISNFIFRNCVFEMIKIQVNQHCSLRRGRLPALDAEEPKTRIRQLEGCALNHLLGSSAASGRQKRQNLIGSS